MNDPGAQVHPMACSSLLFNCEIFVNLYTYHIPGIPDELCLNPFSLPFSRPRKLGGTLAAL